MARPLVITWYRTSFITICLHYILINGSRVDWGLFIDLAIE